MAAGENLRPLADRMTSEITQKNTGLRVCYAEKLWGLREKAAAGGGAGGARRDEGGMQSKKKNIHDQQSDDSVAIYRCHRENMKISTINKAIKVMFIMYNRRRTKVTES